MSAGSALLLLLALAADPRWGLKLKADEGCIGPAELAEALEKKLGRAMFGAKPDVIIEGWVRGDGPRRWRARLTLVGADGSVQGSREVTAEGTSCRSIDESVTLVAAVMIDPGSAMKAAPPPTPVEPTPPAEEAPSSEPTPLIVPKLPPREQWPGYLVVDGASFSQDGRWMSRGTFYRVVGRTDLEGAHARRVATKVLAYVLGSGALATGVVLMLLQAANVSCVRYSGNSLSPGQCLETTPWPVVSGAITAALGLVAIVFGAVLRSVPTSEQEDRDLADTYNQKLKPPPVPVTASLLR